MKKALTVLLLIGGLALAQADGAKLYAQCAGCHQRTGKASPGPSRPSRATWRRSSPRRGAGST
jgi:mono/diheme cytochrome c family protein